MTEALDVARILLLTALILAGLFAAFRFFGFRGLVVGLGTLGLAALYLLGRRDGRDRIIEKERADVGRAERQADEARVRARIRDADPERLRDDDGFRRD